ncbi:MAG: hypothetical protein WD970_00115 [Patescibacteria group bacterium]
MRQYYLILLAILLVGGALVIANWRLTTIDQTGENLPEISLSNLPTTYCPTEAEVFHTSNQLSVVIVAVSNCRSISLSSLDLTSSETIYLKLPHALGVAVEYSDRFDRYIVTPRVGDADNNNIINELDQSAVLEEMFESSSRSDVNMDNQINAEDLALTRINQAVGVNRPDGVGWTL